MIGNKQAVRCYRAKAWHKPGAFLRRTNFYEQGEDSQWDWYFRMRKKGPTVTRLKLRSVSEDD